MVYGLWCMVYGVVFSFPGPRLCTKFGEPNLRIPLGVGAIAFREGALQARALLWDLSLRVEGLLNSTSGVVAAGD